MARTHSWYTTKAWDVMEATTLEVSSAAKHVLVLLINRDGSQGIWPKIETLGARQGVGRRTIQRLLRELEEAGLVTCEINGGGSRRCPADRRPNFYEVQYDRIPGRDDRDDTPRENPDDTPDTPDPERGVRSDTQISLGKISLRGSPQQQSARAELEATEPPVPADPPAAAAVALPGTQTDEAWALGRLMAVAGAPSIGLDAAGCRALVPSMVTALERLQGDRGEAEAWLRRVADQAQEKPKRAGWLRTTLQARAGDATPVSDGSTRPELQLHRARSEERQPAPYPISLTLRALKDDPEGWELVRHDPGSARSFLEARYPREFAAWAEQAGVPA